MKESQQIGVLCSVKAEVFHWLMFSFPFLLLHKLWLCISYTSYKPSLNKKGSWLRKIICLRSWQKYFQFCKSCITAYVFFIIFPVILCFSFSFYLLVSTTIGQCCSHPTCPEDDEPINDGEIRVDKGCLNEIKRLIATCPGSSNGCPWRGGLDQLEVSQIIFLNVH